MNQLIIPNTFNNQPFCLPSNLDSNFSAISNLSSVLNEYSIVVNDTGTLNNYVATLPISISSIQKGQRIVLIPQNTNTGSCTLNLNGLGATSIYSIQTPGSINYSAIVANVPAMLVYGNYRTSSIWYLLNDLSNSNALNNLTNGFRLTLSSGDPELLSSQYGTNTIYWTPFTSYQVTLPNLNTNTLSTVSLSEQVINLNNLITSTPQSLSGSLYDIGVAIQGNQIVFSLAPFNQQRSTNFGMTVINSNYMLIGSIWLDTNNNIVWTTNGEYFGGPIGAYLGLSNYYNLIWYASGGNLINALLCSSNNVAYMFFQSSISSQYPGFPLPGNINNGRGTDIPSVTTTGYPAHISSDFNLGAQWLYGPNQNGINSQGIGYQMPYNEIFITIGPINNAGAGRGGVTYTGYILSL